MESDGQKILFWEWVVKRNLPFEKCLCFPAKVDDLQEQSTPSAKICPSTLAGRTKRKRPGSPECLGPPTRSFHLLCGRGLTCGSLITGCDMQKKAGQNDLPIMKVKSDRVWLRILWRPEWADFPYLSNRREEFPYILLRIGNIIRVQPPGE